jgi:tRNA(Ile)-lysidine synthase
LRRFRARAQKHLEKFSRAQSFKFFTLQNTTSELKSESEMREFRYTALQKMMEESASKYLMTAHHLDDVLETRMLRLVRGTGPDGLAAMKLRRGFLIRPLLDVSRSEIELYAKRKKINWCDDPSNKKVDALRNWMRHKWFDQLEKKRRGAKKSLARSLELIVNTIVADEEANEGDENQKNICIDQDRSWSISRHFLEGKSAKEVSHFLAQSLRRNHVRGYSQAHIEEIMKRLDSRKKTHTFTLLDWHWTVTTTDLCATRLT